MMEQISSETKKLRERPVVVLGTVGQDAHVAGSSVLRYALNEAGFDVVFLGAMAQVSEFIDAAKESAADAIWVSSLYGMGRLDLEGFGDLCIEAGIGNVLRYIGGILVTDPEDWEETREIFEKIGFNRVYPPGTRPEEAIRDIREDLAR